ncbi:hypothetical protein [Bradyrhizobium japonicum]|uniref:hypothetical protein n=1 Tax=Bradyrhizobium japonicum TaxID=375 RepID=UPI00209D8C54|nr:hypothetical protein [Bradyrhizobium japonicum]MCP1761910.1 hypothetical protein [Bradyrhizobium japonicum]MCP1793490.1 hypothetical protein [Bradyrhizobium japonicum]MCP1805923.1 hypothetical protein [Bradyrhizobium japonicum]MCP1812326.1 hypothetical protein [Bradyrhizobium japonicum]MCP1873631.1 hypothetical protein [Bradyrhizobium japonicum]
MKKGAGAACQFQKFHKGCAVHHTARMPFECGVWNCRWLVNDDAAELSRPDRSHYVIDLMPDFVTIRPADGGEPLNIQVVQIWCDPNHRDAHRDPALRRWMMRRAEQGIAALIRFNAREALAVFAPPFDVNGEWHEVDSGVSTNKTHTLHEIEAALGSRASVVVQPEKG